MKDASEMRWIINREYRDGEEQEGDYLSIVARRKKVVWLLGKGFRKGIF